MSAASFSQDLGVLAELIRSRSTEPGSTTLQQALLREDVKRRYEVGLVAGSDELTEFLRNGALQAIVPYDLAVKRTAASLPPDAALVEYVKYDAATSTSLQPVPAQAKERYAAFVLVGDGKTDLVDIGDAKEIDLLAKDFVEAIVVAKGDSYRKPGRELGKRLIGSVSFALASRTSVIVAPDGALIRVPFSALIDDQDTYYLKSLQISFVNSGRDLIHLSRANGVDGKDVIFADPAFDVAVDDSGMRKAASIIFPDDAPTPAPVKVQFSRLRWANEEAVAIQKSMNIPSDQVFLGQRASATALRNLSRPRLLHIATHGYAELGDNDDRFAQDTLSAMVRTGLALSGANDSGSGAARPVGLLSALEMTALNLRGTQLVVLSACSSGVESTRNLNGLYGMRKALAIAGARSIVVSYWNVFDESTKNLMAGYYEKIGREKKGRFEALRESQLEMLKNAATAHPAHWASFSLFGDRRSLASKSSEVN